MKRYCIFTFFIFIATLSIAQPNEKCDLTFPEPEGIANYYTDVYTAFPSIFPANLLKKNKIKTITILNEKDSLYGTYHLNKKGFVTKIQDDKSTYNIKRNRKQQIIKSKKTFTENKDIIINQFEYKKDWQKVTRQHTTDGKKSSPVIIEKTFSKQGFIQSYKEYFSSDTSNYIIHFDNEEKSLNLRDIDEFLGEKTIFDTKYFYDNKNRVTKFIDYENNKSYGETTYTYNSKNQLTKITDSYYENIMDMSGNSGTVDVGDNHYHVTTFEYDDNGLLKTIQFKSGKTVCKYKVTYE